MVTTYTPVNVNEYIKLAYCFINFYSKSLCHPVCLSLAFYNGNLKVARLTRSLLGFKIEQHIKQICKAVKLEVHHKD